MTISVSAQPLPLRIDADQVIRIARTRGTLDSVVDAFLEGTTAKEIAAQSPSLDLADVYAVIGYYLRQRAEVEDYLNQRRNAATQVREQNEACFQPVGVKARLVARRQGR